MEDGTLHVKELMALNGREVETPNANPDKRAVDEFSRHTIWMTYREGFSPLPHGKKSDTGWGCMIRSLQMALAQAFVTLILGLHAVTHR